MDKNKTGVFLFFIILIAFIFRILFIDKPLGLSYDEAVSYSYAIKSFPFGIINGLATSDLHMPLYFLLLNLWIKILGNGDIILRLFSVLIGCITVFVGYFLGKEIKDKFTGILCSLLFALNSLAIYYSQDVRFYVVIILFSALSYLYFVKSYINHTYKNFFLLFLCLVLLSYTNILGILFLWIITVIFLLHLVYNKYYDAIKKFCFVFATSQIALIPLFIFIYKIISRRGISFPSAFFYDNQVLYGIIQNWFSPVLVNINNNSPQFLLEFINSISLKSIIFILVPVIIFFVFIFKSLKKELNLLIFISILIFISVEILGSILGKFTILTRYTLYVIPALILLCSDGFNYFKNKLTPKLLIICLICINLTYLIFAKNSSFKMQRISGQKIPAIALMNENIKKGDIVIYQIRTNLSDKYYYSNFDKYSEIEIFFDNFGLKSSDIDDHNYYRQLFKNKNNENFKKYFKEKIYNKMQKGNKLVIISQKDYMPYDKDTFYKIINQDKYYFNQPLLFLKLYKTNELLLNNSYDMLHKTGIYNMANWIIYVFVK